MTTLRCLRMRVQILIFAVKFNQVSCSCFRSDSISKIRSPKEVWNSFPKPAIFENFAERTPIKICKKKGCSKGVQIFDVHWCGIWKMKPLLIGGLFVLEYLCDVLFEISRNSIFLQKLLKMKVNFISDTGIVPVITKREI